MSGTQCTSSLTSCLEIQFCPASLSLSKSEINFDSNPNPIKPSEPYLPAAVRAAQRAGI